MRLREGLAQFRMLPRALRLCRSAAPRLTAAWAALLLLSGLLPLVTVYATKALVDAVAGGAPSRAVATAVALLGAALLAGEVLRGATGAIRVSQAERVRDHLSGLILERSAAADLAFYETPEFFDRLHRAKEESRYRPLALLESAGGILQNGLTFAAMAAVLLPFGVLMPAALLASTLPALWVATASVARLHRWRRLRTADERRAAYLESVLSRGEEAAEVRLLDLAPELRRRWDDLRANLRAERVRLARRQAVAETLAGAFGLAVSAAAFVLVALRAARGALTLGELALFWQAFHTGQRLMRTLLADAGQVFGHSLFLGDLFEFLSLSPRVTEPAAPEAFPGPGPPALALEGVTFAYPGAARPVLRDFDLAVPAGRITALVGENGCGKSTIVKLLCRLYDPDEGRVAYGGADLRRLPLADLRRRLAVLFQDPVHYHLTAGENIALGDLSRRPGPADLAEAARSAGAEEVVGSLPGGYDALLGKGFPGGTELSHGEWQRVALARALVREAPVLLLDEPTSHMDSWAEEEFFARFREEAAGRTVLLVTHRFSTARRADRIHVLGDGRIVESGTHEDLVAAGGRYAAAWRAQTGASPVSPGSPR